MIASGVAFCAPGGTDGRPSLVFVVSQNWRVIQSKFAWRTLGLVVQHVQIGTMMILVNCHAPGSLEAF